MIVRSNPGYRYQDELELARIQSYEPDLQIFAQEDLDDDEEPEARKYWCAICKQKLELLKGPDEWFCYHCGQQYDTKIQDAPIKDLSETKVRVWAELEKYHTYEENDPYEPFAEGVAMDDIIEDQEDIQLINSSVDNRIQRIHVKGSLKKALDASHYFE